VHVFAVPSGKKVEVLDCGEKLTSPKLAWLPDGTRWVVDWDRQFFVWPPGAKEPERRKLPARAEDESRNVEPLPSIGAVALIGGGDGNPELIDAVSGKARALPSTTRDVAASADGRTLVTCEGVAFRVWEPDTLKERSAAPELSGTVNAIAFTADGESLVTGDGRGLRTWSLSGALTRTLDCGAVWALGEGAVLAAASVDEDADTGALLEVATGREVGRVPNRPVLSRDGRLALARFNSANHNVVPLSSTSDGKKLREFTGHSRSVYGIAFSPDGQLAASCDWDQNVCVWRTADAQLAYRFRSPKPAYALAFSLDGKWLAAGCADRIPRLFALPKGTLSHELRGHATSPIQVLAFSPDSKRLATSDDRSVRVWDVASGALVGLFRERAHSLCFSPDSKRLALGGSGHALLLEVAALPTK
jgi:WD40 repeat protein